MTEPAHEPEAGSSERHDSKKAISITAEDLAVRLSVDTKNAEVGIARVNAGIAGFAKAAAAIGAATLEALAHESLDFGAAMAEVNQIIDEADE